MVLQSNFLHVAVVHKARVPYTILKNKNNIIFLNNRDYENISCVQVCSLTKYKLCTNI